MKIDDGVEEREDIGGEGCDVLHRPVMGVKYGEEIVHPGRMNQRPCHYGKEIYLERN